jgi:hypothetical protein
VNSLKKLLIIAASSAALSLPTQAVTIGQQMATIDDGVNASEQNQVNWLNAIINYHNAPVAGTNPFDVATSPADQGPESVQILNYSTTDGPFAAAVFGTKIELESALGGVLGGGYQYAIAKYGGGQDDGLSIVYFLGGTGLDLPDKLPGKNGAGLSHVSFFNGTAVPDGGATSALLGLGVLGLAAIRRKS